nr:hypothetical protein Itr_chr12CG17490 [Ipomoea trifida]
MRRSEEDGGGRTRHCSAPLFVAEGRKDHRRRLTMSGSREYFLLQSPPTIVVHASSPVHEEGRGAIAALTLVAAPHRRKSFVEKGRPSLLPARLPESRGGRELVTSTAAYRRTATADVPLLVFDVAAETLPPVVWKCLGRESELERWCVRLQWRERQRRDP